MAGEVVVKVIETWDWVGKELEVTYGNWLRNSEPNSEPFEQWLRIRSLAPKFGAQWGLCLKLNICYMYNFLHVTCNICNR